MIDKKLLAERLRSLCETLPAYKDYSTADIAYMLCPPYEFGPELLSAVSRAGKQTGLAQPGEGRPGTGPLRGKTVYPLVWRRSAPATGAVVLDYEAEIMQLKRRVAAIETQLERKEP